MLKQAKIIIFVALLIAAQAAAFSLIPRTLNFQGRMTVSGKPPQAITQVQVTLYGSTYATTKNATYEYDARTGLLDATVNVDWGLLDKSLSYGDARIRIKIYGLDPDYGVSFSRDLPDFPLPGLNVWSAPYTFYAAKADDTIELNNLTSAEIAAAAIAETKKKIPPTTCWGTSGPNIYKLKSGKVGIGTSEPTALLTVQDKNVGAAGIVFLGNGADAWIPYYNGEIILTADQRPLGSTGDFWLRTCLASPGSYKGLMRIEGKTGRLGVGTNGSADTKLDISTTDAPYALKALNLTTAETSCGILALGLIGGWFTSSGNGTGLYGGSAASAWPAILGVDTLSGPGVRGGCDNGSAVYGVSMSGFGVQGTTSGENSTAAAVIGVNFGQGYGMRGICSDDIGLFASGHTGGLFKGGSGGLGLSVEADSSSNPALSVINKGSGKGVNVISAHGTALSINCPDAAGGALIVSNQRDLGVGILTSCPGDNSIGISSLAQGASGKAGSFINNAGIGLYASSAQIGQGGANIRTKLYEGNLHSDGHDTFLADLPALPEQPGFIHWWQPLSLTYLIHHDTLWRTDPAVYVKYDNHQFELVGNSTYEGDEYKVFFIYDLVKYSFD